MLSAILAVIYCTELLLMSKRAQMSATIRRPMILNRTTAPEKGQENKPELPHLECSTKLAANLKHFEAVKCLLLLLSQAEALQSQLTIQKGHQGQSRYYTCHLLDSADICT